MNALLIIRTNVYLLTLLFTHSCKAADPMSVAAHLHLCVDS
jgi:hypothetical protein